MPLVLGLIAVWMLAGGVCAAEPESRAAQIQAAREQKAQMLKPEIPSKIEERLNYVKDAKLLERFSTGWRGLRGRFGGMVSGAGFSFGPDFLRRDWADGKLVVQVGSQISTRLNYRHYATFEVPSIAGGRLFWENLAIYHNYGNMPYYGPGPNSDKTGRSNYRMEDTAFDTTLGASPFRHLKGGVGLGYVLNNVGPGTDRSLISTDRQYDPSTTPGLGQQTNFLRWGTFVEFDYRDDPNGPRSGGHYRVRFDDYSDRKLDRHNFQRLDIDLVQYLPFFNKRRVIALRGKTALAMKDKGHTVPFYQQQVLGGGNDLRGFRPFRFYDDNMLLMNAEYRWEVFSGLDMAVFADAGKVFPRRSQLNFSNLESAVGFGFRMNTRNRTFFRIDIGFSHEGFQVWFKFSNLIQQLPYMFSSPPHVVK